MNRKEKEEVKMRGGSIVKDPLLLAKGNTEHAQKHNSHSD